MKRQIRKILMGDTIFSAYSNISVPGVISEKVYLDITGTLIDVSADHWLLCVEPLIFGVWIEREQYAAAQWDGTRYSLYFSNMSNEKGAGKIKKGAEAVMTLEFFDSIEENKGVLLLLKYFSSDIHHFNALKTRVLFARYYRRDGMTFDRFKSFVSAYSYPRQVRIVSFRQDDYYNIFPMDLLGDLSRHNRYVFGLRHTNVALAGILATGKVVVAEVPSGYREMIYGLGKHHSTAPPPLAQLPFDIIHSKHFQFYIPAWAESYKEIRILQIKSLGSHVLLWGEPIEETVLTGPAEHLCVVHFLHYLRQKNKAAWRLI